MRHLFAILLLLNSCPAWSGSRTLIKGDILEASTSGRIGSTGAPDSKAVLDLVSTSLGFLPPRMSTTQRDAIASPTTGLACYNTTTGFPNFYDGSAWRSGVTSTAALTASRPVVTDSSGFAATPSATLSKAFGGTAQDNSSLTFPSTGTVFAGTPSNHGMLISGSGATVTVLAPDASTTKVWTSGGASADPGWQTPTSAPTQGDNLNNVGLSATISSSTLIIALKQSDGSTDCGAGAAACKVGFHSTTATSGDYQSISFTAAASLTLGTTASIGNASGAGAFGFIYLIQDTTSEVCISNALLDEGTLNSATATPATTGSTLYCTNNHTTRPIRLVGYVSATWSNPNWSTIAALKVWPFDKTLSGTFGTSFGNPFTSTQSPTATYVKVGKMVTITIPSTIAACSVAQDHAASTGSVPGALRPASDVYIENVYIEDNTAVGSTPGIIRIFANGDIFMYKNGANTNFTAAGSCGWLGGYATYQAAY